MSSLVLAGALPSCALFAMSPAAYGQMQEEVLKSSAGARAAAIETALRRAGATAFALANNSKVIASEEVEQCLARASMNRKASAWCELRMPPEVLRVSRTELEDCNHGKSRVLVVTRDDGSRVAITLGEDTWGKGPNGYVLIHVEEQITSTHTFWVRQSCDFMPRSSEVPGELFAIELGTDAFVVRTVIVAAPQVTMRCTSETY